MDARIFKLSALSEKTSLQTRYNSMLAGNPALPTALSGFVGIASFSASNSTTNTVTFSNFASDYKHLYIIYQGQGTVDSGTYMYFNNDTNASNYTGASGMTFTQTSSSAGTVSNVITNGTGIQNLFYALKVSDATQSGATVAYINDYSKSNKLKTVTGISSTLNNTSNGVVKYVAGQYTSNTSPIYSITIQTASGYFAQNSKIALFGVN